jgi:hypothetical protein
MPWKDVIATLKANDAIAVTTQEHADALALAEAVLISAGESDANIWQEDHEDIIKLARKVAGR